jgi:hypothetical protein
MEMGQLRSASFHYDALVGKVTIRAKCKYIAKHGWFLI